MAESVHQVVRGNPVRAASTVESIAGGETPPPELEVVRTPRTGIALTHRLVTLFSGEPSFRPTGPRPRIRLRANAEPHLNAWAAKLLGNPANVRCMVERLDPATGKVLESKELRLDQLRLAPLDFIYAVEGGQGGQQAEIEQRILYTIMRQPDGFRPVRCCASIRPQSRNGKPNELGYGEFSELLRAARKLIAGARGIDADDLNLPERTSDSSVDVAELEQRADRAEQSTAPKTRTNSRPQLAAPDTADLEALRESDPAFGKLRRGRRRAAFRRWQLARGSPDPAHAGDARFKKSWRNASQQLTRSPSLTPTRRRGTSAITRWHGCASSSAKRSSCCRVSRPRTPLNSKRRLPTAQRCRTAIRSLQPPGFSGWRACATACRSAQCRRLIIPKHSTPARN